MTLPIIRYLTAILLALCIILPTVLQSAKMAIFGCIIILSIPYIIKKSPKLNLSFWLISIALLFSFFGIIYVIYGITRNNPGAASMASVHVAYPLMFSFLAIFCMHGDASKFNSLILKIGTILVATQVLFLTSTLGIDGGLFSNLFLSLYDGIAIVDAGDDYLALSMPSIASIFFILPFAIVTYLYNNKSSPLIILQIYASLGLSAASGRRAFFVSLTLTMLFILLTSYIIGNKIKTSKMRLSLILIVPFSAVVYIVFSGLFNWGNVTASFSSIFDFKTDSSNMERTLQFISMLREIEISPIFGSGAGAAASYIRDPMMPWAYELHYISIIFSFGMLGFIIYSSGIIWIFFMLFLLVKKYYSRNDIECTINYLSLLAGFMCFIISAATNPYLVKFDYMWVIFVPFALISEEMLRVKRSRSRERIY
jgi:hypothetical protein